MSLELQLTEAGASAVRLEDVGKRFGAYTVLESISLNIRPGEIVSLLGPSGCGKTTTLRVIAGFEHQSSGQVFLGNDEVSGRKVYERNIGLVFQDYALFPHMTVFDNVAYGLRQRGWKKADIDPRVRELLELVRLGDKISSKPSQLSGGQQQRIALARALAAKPVVMLLDEPLSALDAKLREELRGDLKAILRAAGTATMIVTHDQAEAMGMSDRIIVMAGGKIVQQGTPEQIYEAPNSRYIAEFVGRANIFVPVGPAQPDGKFWRIPLAGGLHLTVAGTAAELAACTSICVRPQRIKLTSEKPADLDCSNALKATVKDITQLGGDTEIRVQFDGGVEALVVEHSRPGHAHRIGHSMWAVFAQRECIIIR